MKNYYKISTFMSVLLYGISLEHLLCVLAKLLKYDILKYCNFRI